MPIIVFGESAGMIGGDHKDGFVWDAAQANNSYGGDAENFVRNTVGNNMIVNGRWSLVGHIPANAVINSAVGSYIKSVGAGVGVLGFTLHDCATPFGVTPVDEGASAAPAAGSQATYNRSFANPTNTPWAGGGAVSAADNGILSDTIAGNAADAVGTIYNFDFAPIVRLWVLNDATNYGYFIRRTDAVGFFSRFWSQEAVLPANRPYLTVNWDLPPSTAITRQSHTAIHAGIAIM